MKMSGWNVLSRVANTRLTHLQRFMQVDVARHRGIFAVAQLDYARDLHEVDARPIVERAGDRGSGDDQNVEAAIILDQRMRDRAAAAQVAETERVVAIHEDTGIFQAPCHGQSFCAVDHTSTVGFRWPSEDRAALRRGWLRYL